MEHVYADMYDEWEREREGAGLRFWLSLVWDAGRHAAAVHLDRAIRNPLTGGGGEMMGSVLGDVRLGLRQLVRHPTYALTVVVLVAVGIAGNAAVFRVFNGLFLRPLPFENAERLVDLDERADAWDLEYTGVAWPDYVAWSEGNRTFEAMAVYTGVGRNLADDGEAERIDMIAATHTIDDVLGIAPILGRMWSAAEDVPDGPRLVLLTEGFWNDRYARDPGVLGTAITLDGQAYEIIGVLPAVAELLDGADVWSPLQGDGDGWYLTGLGLLREGLNLARAAEDLTAVHKGMISERDVNEVTTPVVTPLRDRYLGESRLGAELLLAAVGLVLLIACANIAGLATARALSRSGELSVRRALGAPRGRVARQLLTESAALGLVGGAIGLALGVWGSRAVVEALRARGDFPAWVQFDLDARFLLVVASVTIGSSLLFGIVPALRSTHAPGRSASGRVTGSRVRRRGTATLVMGEVALAAVLLVVGGLSLLDISRLNRVDPGFTTENVIAYRYQLPRLRYPDQAAAVAYADQVVASLEGLPEVESATVASLLPLFDHRGWFFVAEGAPPRADDEPNPVVLTRSVGPNYFRTLGIRMLQGRAFTDRDGREDESWVIIVNEEFVASHLDGDPDPIGRRVANGTGPPSSDDRWFEVIGVVRDVRHYGVDQAMRPGVFLPYRSQGSRYAQIGVHTRGDASEAMAKVRRVALDVDPEVPPFGMILMETRFADTLFVRRASSLLFGVFAAVALLLAVAGIYGVVSYGVGQRRKEIGIRMAVGANASEVLAQVVRRGMALVVLGIGLGLVSALLAARPMASLLVDVRPSEPLVYGLVAGILLAVAALANYLPARHAVTSDPMGVLRDE